MTFYVISVRQTELPVVSLFHIRLPSVPFAMSYVLPTTATAPARETCAGALFICHFLSHALLTH